MIMKKHYTIQSFTLAEILLVLAIIGIVAALTLPNLLKNYQDSQYKTAYKKAYSDISQAFAQAISQNTLTPRTAWSDLDATTSEWNVMKSAFKVAKDCAPAQLSSCWADGDKVCTGACGLGSPKVGTAASFVDASGRSWAQYYSYQSIYLVDTNGFKGPNKFGKDRWMFNTRTAGDTIVTTGLPAKIGVYSGDILGPASSDWCTYPPCYYKSWLYN
jgi:type II secretory pathway pseudopilin PulG